MLEYIKQTVKRGYSKKQVVAIYDVAMDSIGTTEGATTAKIQLELYLEEQELLKKQIERIEEGLEELLRKTGYYESLISIKGIGVVSAALLIGEVGDLTRFESYEQIRRYAGLNLVENSSGTHKGKTGVSRRGRGTLRSILYRIAFTMVSTNNEMKQLYKYLKERKNNPLKSKQAIIAVVGKVLQIIFTIVMNNTKYEAVRVFKQERLEQLKAA